MLISVQALRAVAAWALLFRSQVRVPIVSALLFAVCQAWTGYGWISEFYRSDIVYEFELRIAICVITIGVGSWASYEYVEKCSYRWLKGWIDDE